MTVINRGKALYDKLKTMIQNFGELIVVFEFDTYETDSSKNTTGLNRCRGKNPVQYQVRDDTNMAYITMKKILSHVKRMAA